MEVANHPLSPHISHVNDAAAFLRQALDKVEQYLHGVDAQAVDLREVAVALYLVKETHARIDEQKKRLGASLQLLDTVLVPKVMELRGFDLFRVPEIEKSFSRRQQMTAKVVDPVKLKEWLRELGQEDMITETVNAGTLAAYCRGLLEEQGLEPPEDAVQLNSYYRIGINKYNAAKSSATSG